MKRLLQFFFSNESLNSQFNFITIITVILVVTIITPIQFEYMDDIFVYLKKNDIIEVEKAIQDVEIVSTNVNKTLSSIEDEYNIYIEIYEGYNNLIYTSQGNNAMFVSKPSYTYDDVLKPRIMKILEHEDNPDGTYFEVRQETYGNARQLVYSSFCENGRSIEIYTSLDVIDYSANTASWSLLVCSLIIMLIIIGIVLIYAKLFIKPLLQISNATKQITNMDFSVNCPTYRMRDLNELSSNINLLAISLNKALSDLRSQNENLEIEIENERKAEKTRRSFVANASHELKTPIAIIQGYTEGIKLGISENSQEYCDIILDETYKMNNLVLRLLELGRYDSHVYPVNKTHFDIHDDVMKLISPRIVFMKEQGINFKYEIEEGLIANSDMDLVKDIINNYISNACSHIDGEKLLKISSVTFEDRYRISVFNTGKQIAKNDIENIWHSFYRADKSHSRSEGRFGLGLSIVTSVQDLLEQEYGVINHENGVEFWFDIEKADKSIEILQ